MAARIVVVAAFLMALGGTAAWAGDGSEQATLRVRLVDYARIRPSILDAARNQTTRIFAAAGVSVVWTTNPADSDAVEVLVLSDPMSDRMIRAEAIASGVLGHAVRSIRRAYILTERVMNAANSVGVDPGDALGDVIAHELGHVLLGENAHSATGIMEPGYLIRSKASRRFTDTQAAVIRGDLLRPR